MPTSGSVYLSFGVFVLLIIVLGIFPLFSKKREEIFNPVVFLCLYLAYYIIPPTLVSKSYFPIGDFGAIPYVLWGAALYLVSFKIGTKIVFGKRFFRKTNKRLDHHLLYYGICLFIIGFLAYYSFNGFSFDLVREQVYEEFDPMASYGHSEAYITSLVSLLPSSMCLLFAYNHENKNIYWIIVLIITLAISVISGYRNTIILALVPFFCFIHLYPKIRHIDWHIWIPAAIALYFAMGIIEVTRNYGKGLDVEKMDEIIISGDYQIEASENMGVYYFSAVTMKRFMQKDPIYFTPIWTAVCMPIPRAVYKNKPDASYLREANLEVYGTITHGAAFFGFTEAFISFYWLGIVVNGLFLGMLGGIFWRNYLKNKKSVGAVLLLSLYNGVLYFLMSRGYLAQGLIKFVYYIIVLCLVTRFLEYLYRQCYRLISTR